MTATGKLAACAKVRSTILAIRMRKGALEACQGKVTRTHFSASSLPCPPAPA